MLAIYQFRGLVQCSQEKSHEHLRDMHGRTEATTVATHTRHEARKNNILKNMEKFPIWFGIFMQMI